MLQLGTRERFRGRYFYYWNIHIQSESFMLLWLCDIQSVLQDLDSGYFFIVLTALLVYAEMNKVLINRCPCWCIQWSLWAMWWGPPTTVTCYRTEIYVTVWILLCANKVIFKQWILLCANKVWKRGKSLFHTRHLLLDLSLDLYCPQPSRKKRKENGTERNLYCIFYKVSKKTPEFKAGLQSFWKGYNVPEPLWTSN